MAPARERGRVPRCCFVSENGRRRVGKKKKRKKSLNLNITKDARSFFSLCSTRTTSGLRRCSPFILQVTLHLQLIFSPVDNNKIRQQTPTKQQWQTDNNCQKNGQQRPCNSRMSKNHSHGIPPVHSSVSQRQPASTNVNDLLVNCLNLPEPA